MVVLCFSVTATLACGCDLKTKALAEHAILATPDHSVHLVGRWLELSLAHNYGSAFSVVRDYGRARWVFAVFPIVLAAVMLLMAITSRPGPLGLLALGLVAGGGLGNGAERLTNTGVSDFIKVNYPWGGNWPLFNVADALVVIGGCVIYLLSRSHKPKANPPSLSNTPPSST